MAAEIRGADSPTELPIALEWVTTLEVEDIDADHALATLREQIMLAAWEHIDEGGVFDAFLPAAAAAVENHRSPFASSRLVPPGNPPDPLEETDKRRKLVQALATQIPEANARAVAGVLLLREDDRDWLIDQIAEAGADAAEPLCDLLPAVFAWDAERRWIERVLDLAAGMPPLQSVLDAVGISISMEQVEVYRRRRANERRHGLSNSIDKTDRSVREALMEAWDTTDRTHDNVWLSVLEALSIKTNGRSQVQWAGSPVEQLPGWPECNDEDVQRAHAQAAGFVTETGPSRDFLAGDSADSLCTWNDAAAYQAWDVLICDGSPNGATSSSLGKWRALLMRKPLPQATTDTRRQTLLRHLSESAPDLFPTEFKAALRLEIAAEPTVGARRLLRHVDALWSDRVAGALRDVAAAADCSSTAGAEIRAKLLEHRDQQTEQELRRRLTEEDLSGTSQDAAVLLLDSCPGEAWSVIGPYLTSLGDEVRSVLGRVVRRFHFDGADAFRGYPMAMAEFYAVLDAEYGEGPDPICDNDSASVEEYSAAHVRSVLLRLLGEEGTWEAVRALEWLRARLTERNAEFRIHLNVARQNAIARNWTGPSLQELTSLFADTSRRVVRSNAHLLSVVVESLKTNLVGRLHGETPMAPFLWEEGRRGPDGEREIAHKPEERISDFLHDHLRTDVRERRVVIHREVQIHNPNPKGRGKQADLMVDAAAAENRDDVCNVVLEVKGAWSREIHTAMEEQLIGTYMRENGCDTGLYVAIWTGKESEKISKVSAAGELQALLDQQAERLSGVGQTLRAVVLDITIPR